MGLGAITVRIGIDPDTIWGMSESLATLALVSGRVLQGEQSYAERLAGLVETLDIFSIEDRVGPAPSAEIIEAFALAPSQGYLDLFAAIVRDGYACAEAAAHGWPILSLVGATASVAEAGEGVFVAGKLKFFPAEPFPGGRAEELELPRKQNLPAPLSAGHSPDLDGPTTETAPDPAAGETGVEERKCSSTPVERHSGGDA